MKFHPHIHPLITFFVGVLALYLSRLVMVGNVFAENSPLLPHWVHTYSAALQLILNVAITLIGAMVLLAGGLSLYRRGLKWRYSTAALVGAVSGGITFITGFLYLTFMVYVTYY